MIIKNDSVELCEYIKCTNMKAYECTFIDLNGIINIKVVIDIGKGKIQDIIYQLDNDNNEFLASAKVLDISFDDSIAHAMNILKDDNAIEFIVFNKYGDKSN